MYNIKIQEIDRNVTLKLSNGAKGEKGDKGDTGAQGEQGLSAFEVWQQNNQQGTYAEYEQYLRVYQIPLTEQQFNAITPDPEKYYFIHD